MALFLSIGPALQRFSEPLDPWPAVRETSHQLGSQVLAGTIEPVRISPRTRMSGCRYYVPQPFQVVKVSQTRYVI